jgi:hypothetical protein
MTINYLQSSDDRDATKHEQVGATAPSAMPVSPRMGGV